MKVRVARISTYPIKSFDIFEKVSCLCQSMRPERKRMQCNRLRFLRCCAREEVWRESECKVMEVDQARDVRWVNPQAPVLMDMT